jgi:hypothetical protein
MVAFFSFMNGCRVLAWGHADDGCDALNYGGGDGGGGGSSGVDDDDRRRASGCDPTLFAPNPINIAHDGADGVQRYCTTHTANANTCRR